jgi:hypothetical protein
MYQSRLVLLCQLQLALLSWLLPLVYSLRWALLSQSRMVSLCQLLLALLSLLASLC